MSNLIDWLMNLWDRLINGEILQVVLAANPLDSEMARKMQLFLIEEGYNCCLELTDTAEFRGELFEIEKAKMLLVSYYSGGLVRGKHCQTILVGPGFVPL